MSALNVSIFLFFIAVWILGIASQVGYFRFLNRNIFGGKKEAFPDNGNSFKRHGLIEKSRPLLLHGLLSGLAAILAAIALFVVATHFGTIYLIVGGVIIFPLIFYFQARSNTRYLVKLVQTTPCPECQKFPMDYVARSADNRRLLVCTQCRTEWDLGPADL